MIAVVDYGMGNLLSVQKAFEFMGHDAIITGKKQDLQNASHIALPGVGAINDALHDLAKADLIDAIKAQIKTGKPFLGICLGMQLLFDYSLENGKYDCLSILSGGVVPFEVKDLKVPHMGWNDIEVKPNPIMPANEYVYFVHSYHAVDVEEKYVLARCNYGYDFVAAVRKDNVYGMQFHPEKSGDVGLRMMDNFAKLK